MKRLLMIALALVTAAHSFAGIAFAQESPDPSEANAADVIQQNEEGVAAEDPSAYPFEIAAEPTEEPPQTEATAEPGSEPVTSPTPAPTATPSATPPAATPTATPASAATAAPMAPASVPEAAKPAVRASQPNVIQGQILEAGTVWMMGELRNEGATPAYNVVVTGKLIADSGESAGTANQSFPYLGPGDTVGYKIEVRNPTSYSRADVSVVADASAIYEQGKMDVIFGQNLQQTLKGKDQTSYCRYEFTGTLKNNGSRAVAMNSVYVWYLDDQGKVVWQDVSYVPSAISQGGSAPMSVHTPWSRDNPQISAATQVRYYVAGRLQ